VVAGLSVLLAGVAVTAWRLGAPLGVDSGVYRAGALAVLHGDPLYGSLRFLPHWSGGLPFTYPPVAAVVFLPLAALPAQLGWGLLAVASVLGLAVALRTSLKGSGIGSRTWLLPVAGIGALVLEPVWRGLGLGQVNVALMALVILDVLVLKRSRRGGILVGLAAAIKLTPLIFVLHLLVTGRRADAARALGTFAGLNVVCAMLMPADTLRYWRAQLLGGDGATSSSWAGNQSLNGMIQRFTDHASWAFALSIVAGLLCLALALPMARTLYRRGEHLGALLVSAFCGLLISPISWTHHWVWVVPLFGLLATRALRAPSVSTLAPLIGLVAIFTGFTVPMMPAGGDLELRWTPIQMVLGNAYVLAALVAGGILAGRLLRSRTTVSVTTVRERRSAPAFGADPVAAALVPINRVSGTP
jgi:alpha-1,2-mannosyltransferase